MSNESMNYVRSEIREAYSSGAWGIIKMLLDAGVIPLRIALAAKAVAEGSAARYAEETPINEKALRCANSERPKSEEATSNLQNFSTTPGSSAQLPPLAADLEGLAVSLCVLAGNVSSEQWEFLKIFRANLRSAAERAAALENGLEVPHEQA